MKRIKSGYAENDETPLNRAGTIVKISLMVLIIVLLAISADMLMEYGDLVRERDLLAAQKEALEERREEYSDQIGADVDRDYVDRYAKENGFVSPDEDNYYG